MMQKFTELPGALFWHVYADFLLHGNTQVILEVNIITERVLFRLILAIFYIDMHVHEPIRYQISLRHLPYFLCHFFPQNLAFCYFFP